jgi:Fe-S-cluster-containing hydrogenase component 2
MASPTDTALPSSNQARHTYVADGRPVGFFTDPTICIGCKACEVACKEWNEVPADGQRVDGPLLRQLGQPRRLHVETRQVPGARPPLGPQVAGPMTARRSVRSDGSSLDVCKHCGNAGCLEACPTGRSCARVSSVYVQDDVCKRLRVLRGGLSLRRDRSAARAAAGRRGRVQMHVLLRPAGRRSHPRLREGLSHGIDSFRAAGRAAHPRRAARGCAPGRGFADATIYNPVDTRSAASTPSSCCWVLPRSSACRPSGGADHLLRGAWTSAAMTSALTLLGACLALAFF